MCRIYIKYHHIYKVATTLQIYTEILWSLYAVIAGHVRSNLSRLTLTPTKVTILTFYLESL